MGKKYDVAVMHDFFVDRLVHTKDLRGLAKSIVDKAAQGGGGIHGVAQSEIRGGNAVNLAHALGRLGAKTLLITHSEKSHARLLLDSFEGLDVEVRVKKAPAGLTVAFEERTNVMLGDVGGAGSFGTKMLDEEDWASLGSAKVVCTVNWAANQLGTELVIGLRRRLGRRSELFLDPADFRDRMTEFAQFAKRITKERTVDWVSMNEQESAAVARGMGLKAKGGKETCLALATALGVRFDLHGVRESYTCDGGTVSSARVRAAKARRLTGAGDVWDAGSIWGRLNGMDDVGRVQFANAAARLYLKNRVPLAPTQEDVRRALQ